MSALRIQTFGLYARVYEVESDGKPCRILLSNGKWWVWPANEPLDSDGMPLRITGTGLPSLFTWPLARLDFL